MACCSSETCASSSNNGSPRFRRVLWIVLAINAGMFIAEIVAGLVAGSAALQADALDFFADAANYAISLAVFGSSLRWRAGAAWVKGASMGIFGLWVLATVVWHLANGSVPHAATMGIIGTLALVMNVACLFLLTAFREGDANMRSVWICSRNDVVANVAVLLAALGVFGTGTGWPDFVVASLMAVLAIHGAATILRDASREWREAGRVHGVHMLR
ncbi:MAG: cation transporter [Martelella sp.]|uniref:cation transporter n=1 Tax=Martelella sp. TaxID=1969699 RepID=UPI000C35A2A2|nr:cation transporter [Martelella sp.]MAU23723.1 cation transporter [Martelella sp.]|tara:strand:- start:402 stop:1049 length:648 start_codon:yes stop_codon:yes gene_type:complete